MVPIKFHQLTPEALGTEGILQKVTMANASVEFLSSLYRLSLIIQKETKKRNH